MTTAEVSADATTDSAQSTEPSRLETLKADHKVAQKELRGHEDAVKSIFDALTASGAKPEKNVGYTTLVEIRDKARTRVERIEAQMETEQKAERTRSFVDPIVNMVGTIEVADATALPASIDIVNINVKRKAAQERMSKAAGEIAVYDALEAAVKEVGVPEDDTESFKPFRIEQVDSRHVKLSVSARGGGNRTGGARGARTLVRITGAGADHSHLVGKTVGKDGDFASFRALLESELPDLFKDLETKKNEKNSNYSARNVCDKKMGLTVEEVASGESES